MANLSPFNHSRSDSGVHTSDLLTPPKSPLAVDDVPFKPKNDDDTSLSMKKGHRGYVVGQYNSIPRRKHNRACLSSEELRVTPPEDEQTHKPQHSKSMPLMTTSPVSLPASKPAAPASTSGRGSVDQRTRRWTLPSKAPATRSRSTTVIAEHRPTPVTPPDNSGLLSPAMITLRRATTVKPNSRKISLTFFPEPKFGRSKNSFLGKLLRTMTGITQPVKAPSWPHVESRRPSDVPVSSDGAQPSHRGSASTVCTQVADIVPVISQPGGSTSSHVPFFRRCSTKYITGDQVLEVIWDENVSSSISAATSVMPRSSERDSISAISRRQSVAVGMLEAQLHKANVQSRRQSSIGADQERKSSNLPESSRQRQGSLQSLLNFKLSRFVNESALPNVPRPKASRAINGKSPAAASYINSTMQSADAPASDEDLPSCSIDFFPPLRSRAGTATAGIKSTALQPSASTAVPASSDTDSDSPDEPSQSQANRRFSTLGSMLGSSSHIRRQSTPVGNEVRKGKKSVLSSGSRRGSAMGMPTVKNIVEDETTPLLSNFGILE